MLKIVGTKYGFVYKDDLTLRPYVYVWKHEYVYYEISFRDVEFDVLRVIRICYSVNLYDNYLKLNKPMPSFFEFSVSCVFQ